MLKEVVLKIYGDVHGVGMRYQTFHKAQELNLMGFVRNLPDGTVEILAQGEKENLKKLIAWIKEEPKFADVKNVKVDWRKLQERYQTFEIRY